MTVQAYVRELVSQIDDFEKKIEELKIENERLTKEIDIVRSYNDNQCELVKDLKAMLEQRSDDRLDKLTKENNDLNQKITYLNTTISDLRQDITNRQAAYGGLIDKYLEMAEKFYAQTDRIAIILRHIKKCMDF